MGRLRLLAVVALCGGMGVGVAGQGMAARGAGPGAATRAGESVAAMKARLAKLKEEAAALEAKISAAEAPAAGTEPAIVTALNALPKNLWPGENDSQAKQDLRAKWLEENIKPGKGYDFSGLVIIVSPQTIHEVDKAPVDAVRVVLDCGKYKVWGEEKGLKVMAVLENVTPADTLDWGEKKTITITGPSKTCWTSGNPVEVTMETSKLK